MAKLVPHFLDLHFFRGGSFRPQPFLYRLHSTASFLYLQPTVSRSPSSLHYLLFSSSLVIHDVLIRKVLVTYRCLLSHVRLYSDESGLFSLVKPYFNFPESILICQNLVQFQLFQQAGRSLLHYPRQRTNIEHVPSQTFLFSELIN